MAKNKEQKPRALRLCEAIGAYFMGTAPVMAPGAVGSQAGWNAEAGSPVTGGEPAGDFQKRQLAELQAIRAGFSPDAEKKFLADLFIYNTMRGNFTGTPDEILNQLHPWILQRLIQKYNYYSMNSQHDAPQM